MSGYLGRRLLLVAFAGCEKCGRLQAFLDDSGFPSAALIPGATWLASAPAGADSLTIVFISADAPAAVSAARIAERAAGESVLFVFDASCAAPDAALLRACQDFLTWPCSSTEITRRLELCGAMREPAGPPSDEDRMLAEFADLHLLGQSPVFVSLLRRLKKAARFEAPVLLEGETGAGKELAAHALHYLGSRRDRPFIPVNCGAIPDNLLENELFGHERGAFTDARDTQEGLVALAHGGTLFLDEVDALTPKGQVALLRFLQNQEYKPLGGRKLRQADVRLVAASNTPLEEAARNGGFRADLLFRLNVLTFTLPPLRLRGDDVVLLARHFALKIAGQYSTPPKRFAPNALEWMRGHAWPGNVRELENFVHRGFLESEGPLIHLPDTQEPLPEEARITPPLKPFAEAKSAAVDGFERTYLAQLIRSAEGNVTLAAKRAGKERRSLGKLLKKHGLSVEH